jgi:hypothetical protein
MKRRRKVRQRWIGAIAVDQTILNLAAAVLGTMGLFAILFEYDVPQLSMSFFGQNPFAMKRDAIAAKLNILFGSAAVLAVLILVIVEIMGDDLPERRHGKGFYGVVFAALVFVGVLLLNGIGAAAHVWARSEWWPQVIESQREIFERSASILDRAGGSDPPAESEIEQASRDVAQIETLLDMNGTGAGDLKARVEQLRSHFRR